ncbi:hypothetical protein EVAR_100352_1 [Eumeta japonica]|uniref:Uncharacterized protein n=1 Tax=Eumeta variegata TaxID=151549 RepID=A0A4C2AGW8_EUMVA|nr:hypothetical protein EVAR_100352_1 [Eumeta japonica]
MQQLPQQGGLYGAFLDQSRGQFGGFLELHMELDLLLLTTINHHQTFSKVYQANIEWLRPAGGGAALDNLDSWETIQVQFSYPVPPIHSCQLALSHRHNRSAQ